MSTVLVVVLAVVLHEGDIHQGASPIPFTPAGHELSFLFEVPCATLQLLVLGAVAPPFRHVPAPLAHLTVPFGPPTEVFLRVGLLTVGALDVVVFTFPLFGWRLLGRLGLRDVIIYVYNHA